MHILLATEIWGSTPHVDELADLLRPSAAAVIVVDPYNGHDPQFQTEKEAYSAFLRQCGHSAFALRVQQALLQATAPVFLIGFSAGATAVWSVICSPASSARTRAVCFYGSAIRTAAEEMPQAPVDLIFPRQEPHYDVAALTHKLARMPLVQCHTVPQEHGFMNPLSANYDAEGANHWIGWLQREIEKVTDRKA